MGLIGSVLALLYCGGSGFYMSPLSFIKRPALWVELISRHRGTHIQVHLHPVVFVVFLLSIYRKGERIPTGVGWFLLPVLPVA